MYRLPKKSILRDKNQFQEVYRHGRSYANRYMVLYVFPVDTIRRVGFAAGRKLGNAVIRNRVKRMMRESYRLNQDKLSEEHTLLLIGRKASVEAGCQEVNTAFCQLCKRAGIWKDKEKN